MGGENPIDFQMAALDFESLSLSSECISVTMLDTCTFCTVVHICAERFQPNQAECGGGCYCDTCFALSDERFENDIWSKHGVHAVQN